MTLEELQQSVDKDFKLNDTELDLESLKTPQLHNKYCKELTKFKLLLTRAEDELRIMKRIKWEYYTGKADPKVYIEKPFDLKILKTDIHLYIESDNDLQRLSQKVSYLKQVVSYLEQLLRSINTRNFIIKNAIDWAKFTSGAI